MAKPINVVLTRTSGERIKYSYPKDKLPDEDIFHIGSRAFVYDRYAFGVRYYKEAVGYEYYTNDEYLVEDETQY